MNVVTGMAVIFTLHADFAIGLRVTGSVEAILASLAKCARRLGRALGQPPRKIPRYAFHYCTVRRRTTTGVGLPRILSALMLISLSIVGRQLAARR